MATVETAAGPVAATPLDEMVETIVEATLRPHEHVVYFGSSPTRHSGYGLIPDPRIEGAVYAFHFDARSQWWGYYVEDRPCMAHGICMSALSRSASSTREEMRAAVMLNYGSTLSAIASGADVRRFPFGYWSGDERLWEKPCPNEIETLDKLDRLAEAARTAPPKPRPQWLQDVLTRTGIPF